PAISDNDRRTLEQGLATELRAQTYGDWTAHLVSLWQGQLAERFQLLVNGDVDQRTADALNKLLAELGAPADGPPEKPPTYTVSGTVKLEDGTPTPGLVVVAIDRDFRAEQTLGE